MYGASSHISYRLYSISVLQVTISVRQVHNKKQHHIMLSVS